LSDDIYIAGSAVWTGEPQAPARWYDKPARLQRMDRLCALALVAADGALVDAGAPRLDGERTAVVFGSAYGCHATNEDYYRGLLREGPAGASPRLFAYTLPSSPAGEISIHYGIRGPATTAAPGWHAGLAALAEGVQHLRSGRADRVLVVAAEVATELLKRLTGGSVRDASAAVLLGREGRARITAADEHFGVGPAERAETFSVAPLLQLHDWLATQKIATGRNLSLRAADPGGGAAQVVVEWPTSSS
jgi:Beta-ketoacyl synthase, N-terminal domain